VRTSTGTGTAGGTAKSARTARTWSQRPVETLPLSEWRRLFEVNLFGHIAVTQALLPALLRHSGRVVTISSVGGRVALPTYGPYAGTKFALEAVSDSLRRELAPWGVRVVVVEPGAVRTRINAQSAAHGGTPAENAARVIANAVTARKPRTRYTVGRDAALITRLARVLPDRLLDRVLAASLRPHYPEFSVG
jgi:NAD(P)-dependent dehydrogenase (short-subunit alcohol dehydrogenase family)